MTVDLLALHNSPETIATMTGQIRDAMLRDSRRVREANFQAIDTDDLARLFQLYDSRFFGGWLAKAVASTAGATLTFRLSSTMTRAGGKTIRKRRKLKNGTLGAHFEIAVATRMLFMNFREAGRPVTVCGLVCTDRLAALQRIMEHEMLHLAEFLFWGKSSCNQPRFKSMAKNIFGHEASRHDLVTSVENAAEKHAVSIGSRVTFHFDGEFLDGIVNRIHHRATVLVEAADGMKYRNGKRYRKYYVPVPMLTIRESGSAS
jgi:hypothetical protein